MPEVITARNCTTCGIFDKYNFEVIDNFHLIIEKLKIQSNFFDFFDKIKMIGYSLPLNFLFLIAGF